MPDALQTAAHVALLAPVPLVHLEDGHRVVESEGKVAFGSRAWETFRQLDDVRKGQPVDVYIYASHSDGNHDFEVSWRGPYIGHVEGNMGSHPDGMRYRPTPGCEQSHSKVRGRRSVVMDAR